VHDLSHVLADLYGATSVLVALYDDQDRLRYANPAFRAAYHLDLAETPLWPDLMRRNFLAGRGTVIQAEDFEAWLISTQSRRGKIGFRAFETDLVDGRWLWMTETVQSNGWMLCIAADITPLRAEERTVRQARDLAIRASQTDDLTGVANRRFVMARMEEMLRGASVPGSRGSIAILDIDHFKQINDRYGHQTGDLVLCDFAKRVQAQVRRADCFGRVGGEEFLLVLPETRIEQAQVIVERMLQNLRATPIVEPCDLTYTFSAGIAQAQPGDTGSHLYARADQALYAAKVGGRSCVHLHQPALVGTSAA
jgi:diguanylate cyclase (GGDEF)-like protein